MSERIYIYHTNDIHSHFEQSAKIATVFHEARKKHKAKNEHALFFDIGDCVDLSHPFSEATNGKANVKVMNAIGFDSVTIGNNEGITLSKQALDALYDEANFHVLVANILEMDGTYPSWTEPYIIYTLDSGIKIGVVGVTAAYETFYEILGWDIRDPFEILPPLIKQLRAETDLIIVLSHLGINDDEKLAREIEGIDVILGGHTHHLLQHGKMINGTLLAAAGKFGMNVGEINITFNSEHEIIGKEAYVRSLDTVAESAEIKELLTELEKDSTLILEQEVIYLQEPIRNSWFEPSPLAQLLCEGLKEWCEADIAMINAGVLLDELPAGVVTKGYLHKILPHPINPCKIEIRGDALKEVIQQSFTDRMQHFELKGLGFRGKILGRMVFDGIEVETKLMADGLRHVAHIEILGQPIDKERMYQIATLDMFTFGFLYPELKNAANKHYYLPEMLRDILSWKLRRLSVK